MRRFVPGRLQTKDKVYYQQKFSQVLFNLHEVSGHFNLIDLASDPAAGLPGPVLLRFALPRVPLSGKAPESVTNIR